MNYNSKKIISFSIWGDEEIYNVGAIKNADIAMHLYPDWFCRFYIASTVPNNTISELKRKENVEIVEMNEEGGNFSRFWRFYPAGEKDVEALISRDCDSRLNIREKKAVEEWISSDRSFHIMRDHPEHAVPILAGMWGVKGMKLKNIKNMIETFNKQDRTQVDQDFLRKEIYPIIKDDCLIHDPFFDKKPFPVKRSLKKEFVGEPFDENDNPIGDYRKMVR